MARQFDGYGAVPIDFSPLAALPAAYQQGQQFADQRRLQGNRERTLAELQAGAPIGDVARKLMQAGDIEGGLSLAKLADAQANRDFSRQMQERQFGFQQQEAERAQRNSDRGFGLQERQFNQGTVRDERDFGFRQGEAQRTQANADRGFGLQERTLEATLQGNRVPAGFRPTPEGGLAPIPGGPQDPTYLKAANEAKEKPRQFNVSDITKLSEEGGKFADVSGFGQKFEDRFAGYKVQALGNASMLAGRNLPESVVGKDVAEAATFWQGYDRYKNVIRNELYGSALTAPETAAFERADVNPGMDPKQIRRNLETQRQIVQNGLRRKANALIQSGYPADAIAAAYGLDLKDIGVSTDRGKPPTRVEVGPQMQPGTQPVPPAFASDPEGTEYRKDGKVWIRRGNQLVPQ